MPQTDDFDEMMRGIGTEEVQPPPPGSHKPGRKPTWVSHMELRFDQDHAGFVSTPAGRMPVIVPNFVATADDKFNEQCAPLILTAVAVVLCRCSVDGERYFGVVDIEVYGSCELHGSADAKVQALCAGDNLLPALTYHFREKATHKSLSIVAAGLSRGNEDRPGQREDGLMPASFILSNDGTPGSSLIRLLEIN